MDGVRDQDHASCTYLPTPTLDSSDGHMQEQPHGSEKTCVSVSLVSASALIR
jgi:hypothetical protein